MIKKLLLTATASLMLSSPEFAKSPFTSSTISSSALTRQSLLVLPAMGFTKSLLTDDHFCII